MRVEPELPDHPKYQRLKRRIGDFAMEALVRLWGHCQQNQRGARWFGADAEYVELIAKWDGDPGLLYRSLLETNWIEVLLEGGILIHDWEEMNSQIVMNWVNGKKGGRHKKGNDDGRNNPLVNQVRTSGETQTQTGLPGISGAVPKNPLVTPIPNSVTPTETQREPVQRNVTEHNETKQDGPADGHHSQAGSGLRYDLAVQVVEFLNQKTGADFKGTKLELDLVAFALARVGNDIEGVKKMVARQVALWIGTPRLSQGLRPQTLFDDEKFDGYFAMRELPTDLMADPASRRRELEEAIQKHPANRQSVFHRADATPEQRETLKKLRAELAELNGQKVAASSGA